MKTASRVLRIKESPSGGWDISETTGARALTHSDDLDAAILVAQKMMVQGGVLRIVNREGFSLDTRVVPDPGDKPWWYVQPRMVFWVMSGIFVIQGIIGTVGHRAGGLLFWIAAPQGVLGLIYLAVLTYSKRMDVRSASERLADPPA